VVIEFLTFMIPAAERAHWMEVEERTWSRFLERQPGFVRKRLWVEAGDDDHVHAVIEWESMEHWHSIPDGELAAVDADMGEWMRAGTCRTFEVLRDC
jgi:uncharacterized protein (TIGR03792 family)